MAVNWNWLLIVVGALLVLVEVAAGGFAGFDLVLIGSSFLIGGALGLALGSAAVGLIAASALCLLYIAAGRRWVRARMKRPGLPTNTDALIGLRGLVAQPVSEHQPGQVRVRDEIWRARPAAGIKDAIEAGAAVIVEAVDGVTLIVRRAS